MTPPEGKTKALPQDGLAQLLATLEANTTLLAFLFGLCFVAALLVLAIWFPQPTPFQYTVFRITLALAAAGIAGVIPGMIRLTVKPGTALLIHAGGALAVFVMVYLLSPAALPPEQPAPSPLPKEKPEKLVKSLHLLKISNVDAVENGVHILNFTPTISVHTVKLSNIGDAPIHLSLVGFPTQYFHTTLMYGESSLQGHSDRDVYIVFLFGFPEREEYVFQVNDSAGGTAHVAIRLNKDRYYEYAAQQIQQVQEKYAEGASMAELHQEAKRLVVTSGGKELTPPQQESLAESLLRAAGQREAADIAAAQQALYEWQYDIRYLDDSSVVEQFLQRFPMGSHVLEAKKKLEELRAAGR